MSEIQPPYLVPRTSKIQENGTVMRWLLSVNVYVNMYSQVGTTYAKTPPSTTSPTSHTVNQGTQYHQDLQREVDVVNQVNLQGKAMKTHTGTRELLRKHCWV